MAAATNTDSICVAGGWHWGRFVPYSDVIEYRKCKRPYVAFHRMHCFNCNLKKNNCRSMHRGNSTGTFPCIAKIKKERVTSLVDQVLGDSIRSNKDIYIKQ